MAHAREPQCRSADLSAGHEATYSALSFGPDAVGEGVAETPGEAVGVAVGVAAASVTADGVALGVGVTVTVAESDPGADTSPAGVPVGVIVTVGVVDETGPVGWPAGGVSLVDGAGTLVLCETLALLNWASTVSSVAASGEYTKRTLFPVWST